MWYRIIVVTLQTNKEIHTLAMYYGNVRQLDRIADSNCAERHSPEGLIVCSAFQGKRYIKIEKAGHT